MEASEKHPLKLVLGLMVVVAVFCGSLQFSGLPLREHVHANDDGCELEDVAENGFCHGHVDHCQAGEDSHAGADLAGHDCPDYPHHHHHDGAGCCHTVVHLVTRPLPGLALIAPSHGRSAMEWIAMQSDLDAVCELDTPPII